MQLDGIRALVFDFDGLILETEGPIFQSWQELYQSYNHQLSWEIWATIIGTNEIEVGYDPLIELEKEIGHALDRPAVAEARRQRELELVMTQPILPGVIDYLDDARRLGLKLGVASSSSRQWVIGHLERLGLREYFTCVRTGDDVPRTKPDPAVYLQVLECLGVNAAEAVALEDSPNGALAAKRAGIFCVAVPNEMTRSIPNQHADLRLDSLLDVSLEQLVAMIKAAANRRGRDSET
jgi:HAD superfamily hydrolase (TIGR01509 family)